MIIYYRDENGDVWDESQVEEMFDELLDQCYEELRMGELSWSPSTALQRLDPVAYRCGLADYLSEFEEVDEPEDD